jgi:hypothetical protein
MVCSDGGGNRVLVRRVLYLWNTDGGIIVRQIVIESTGNYLGEVPDRAPYNEGLCCHGDTVPVIRGGAEYLCRISTAGTVPESVTFPGESSPVPCIVNYGVELETA